MISLESYLIVVLSYQHNPSSPKWACIVQTGPPNKCFPITMSYLIFTNTISPLIHNNRQPNSVECCKNNSHHFQILSIETTPYKASFSPQESKASSKMETRNQLRPVYHYADSFWCTYVVSVVAANIAELGEIISKYPK